MTSTSAEMGERITAQLPVYEAGVLAAQVEAFHEMRDQRDRARRIAASFEAEIAKVRELHRRDEDHGHCNQCGFRWPCETAQAVYL